MIAYARLAKGKVFHLFDVKWSGQRVYRSICGLYREHWTVVSETIDRQCKGCKLEWSRHQRKPPSWGPP